jgi:tRNA-modifying protein YgfZ
MSAAPRVVWLRDRGVVRLKGADAYGFLQALITNDMALLSPQRALWAAMLSPQGRYLVDFFVVQAQGDVLLDVDAASVDALVKKLTMYRLRADVQIQRDDASVYAIFGGEVAPDGNVVYRDERSEMMGWRSIIAHAQGANDVCREEDATMQDYEHHRLSLGVPEGAKDAVVDRSLMLEMGYDLLGAVSFSKGCYVGQEVTARSKHRGELRKALFLVEADTALPVAGTPVMAGDDELGELRSSEGGVGLALLRLDRVAEAQDSSVTAGGVHVTVRVPAWRTS